VFNADIRRTTAGLFGYAHITGGYWGGQAEYVRVPVADVAPMKVPEGMDDDHALFLSDILPTGWQAASYCDLKGGESLQFGGAGLCPGVGCATGAGVAGEHQDPRGVWRQPARWALI